MHLGSLPTDTSNSVDPELAGLRLHAVLTHLDLQAARRFHRNGAIDVTDQGVRLDGPISCSSQSPISSCTHGEDVTRRAGLGLSICRNIVTGLGGEIATSSACCRGQLGVSP